MSEKLLLEISAKLDKLIAISAVQSKDTVTQTKVLRSLGFTFKEVSELTGIPESTLKSREIKKKSKK